MAYCAHPGYSTPCCVIVATNLSVRTIPVPPLKCAECAEKVASFHKLVPPRSSMKRAWLRHAFSGIFVSCTSIMSAGGVVCLKRSFTSCLFLLPVSPWPIPLTFWVAIVILSPFMGDNFKKCWIPLVAELSMSSCWHCS